MSLDLLYITNNKEEAIEAENVGVDIIVIDLEKNGKYERQGHLDTVISNHTFEDIKRIKPFLKKTKILTRINPIYKGSKEEIEKVIELGTDIIMLPMFKTKEEVEVFINLVKGRVKTCLLLETSQALCRIDDILEVAGIDMIHIGLNDLHLSLHLNFMFECLNGGIAEYLINKIKIKNIKYGIGGIARIGEGELPAEMILAEHVRLGSNMVILSRTFKNSNNDLKSGVKKLREKYFKLKEWTKEELENNSQQVRKIVNKIAKQRREQESVL
ncbi:aldolase/citrate lyase family protein [Fusobacterium varium]|uniref:aldolase/citrate lyase family protein n=1 Tax=Fusobacterium varium TaxID=856 RepID=UPI0032C016A1